MRPTLYQKNKRSTNDHISRRILSVVLAAMLCFNMVPTQAVAEAYAATGTQDVSAAQLVEGVAAPAIAALNEESSAPDDTTPALDGAAPAPEATTLEATPSAWDNASTDESEADDESGQDAVSPWSSYDNSADVAPSAPEQVNAATSDSPLDTPSNAPTAADAPVTTEAPSDSPLQTPEEALLTVSCAPLDALYSSQTDDIRYNLQSDTTQTILLNFMGGLLHDEWLTVSVHLPLYGFKFADNLIADLNDQAQIQNATFTKDSNGYNTTLTFDLYGSVGNTHHVDVQTKYAPLTNAQCAQVIQSGWQESALTVSVVRKSDGAELATAQSPNLRPNDGITDGVVTVAEHQWISSSDRVFANDSKRYGGFTYDMYDRDVISISLKVLGSKEGADDVGLVRLNDFKLYVPDERLTLYRIRGYTAPRVYSIPKRPLTTYFSCDMVRYNDNDGKGTYYLFKARPNAPVYNSGTDDERENIEIRGTVFWNIRSTDDEGKTIDYLDPPGDKTYRAHDMQLDCSGADGSLFVATGPGSQFYTPPVTRNNNYGFYWTRSGTAGAWYGEYKKTWDASQNRYTSSKKVVAGASYGAVPFVGLYRQSGAGATSESRGPRGDISEVYTFPYEVQPTAITLPHPVGNADILDDIDGLSYEVTAADGSTRTVTVPTPDTGWFSGLLSFDGLEDGERVSKVWVHWSFLWNSASFDQSAAVFFDFTVTDKDEQGNPLVGGELLHIGYECTWNETEKTFQGSVANPGDYLYLEVEAPKCPWIMDDRVGQAERVPFYYPRDYQEPREYLLCSHVYLKGLGKGATRNWMDNPRVELQVTHSNKNNTGFKDKEWIALLTGEMTLTKNLSGWKIVYGLYDEATQTSRTATYEIGTLTGDTKLTREMLGMKDTESFTSFVLSYDGHYTFTESREVRQTFTHRQDQSEPGVYNYTDLIKDIKMMPRPTGFNGDHLLGGTLQLRAVLSHGPSCDRTAHTDGVGETSRNGTPYDLYSGCVLYSDYTYTISGPNFKIAPEENTVHQGGTIVSDLVFNLKYWNALRSEYNSKIYSALPYEGVPEAMYVELTDPLVDLDLSNEVFCQSLAEHGMTTADVSVVNVGGKRWIKLVLPQGKTVAWGPRLRGVVRGGDKSSANAMDFPFKIALRVWQGHELGACKPFGEVYYDLADYPSVYTGDEASGYRTVKLEGTVSNATTEALTGSTDRQLYQGDASVETFEVLRNYATGATVDPGKHGVVHTNEAMSYAKADRPAMFASVSMSSPNPERTSYDYTAVLSLPSKDDTYSWTVNGESHTGVSDHTLLLAGAASVEKSTLGDDSHMTFSYSKTGADGSFVSADAVGSSWRDYRYVKVHIDKVDSFKSVEVRFPVTTDDTARGTGKLAYLGGTWAYAAASGGTLTTPTVMSPAVYAMVPSVDYAVTKQLKAPAELAADGTYDHAYPFGQGAFSFTITPVAGAPMPDGAASATEQVSAATIGAGGTQTGGIATFAGNEFDVPGTYKYEIREDIPEDATNAAGVRYADATDAQKAAGGFAKDGVVYSERVSTVTVTVEQDAAGRLTATSSTVTGNPVTYTNRYKVEDAALVLGGTKVLKDATGAEIQRSGFSFVLEEVTGSGTNVATTVRRNAALSDDNKTFTFAPLEFTQTDLDAGAERVYHIREVIPEDAVDATGKTYKDSVATERMGNTFTKLGVTFDQTVYEARVTLANSHNGTMTPRVSYRKLTDDKANVLASPQEVDASGVVFNNTYVGKASIVLHATKDLAGREWTDDDKFEFRLQASGEMKEGAGSSKDEHGQIYGGTVDTTVAAPLPADTTATATKASPTTSFAGIPFTSANIGHTYVYRLSEVVPEGSAKEANMAYDTAQYGVLVTPYADNGDGTIAVEVTYWLLVFADGGTTVANSVRAGGTPVFVNKSVGHGTATIFADKDLEGRDWTDDDRFEFELIADRAEKPQGTTVATQTVPMPASAGQVATATKADESPAFGAIHYELADEGYTYYYKIREREPDGAVDHEKDGILYSTDERTVRVSVSRYTEAGADSEAMTAKVEYQVKNHDGTELWITAPLAEFDNVYTAAPVTVSSMQVQKQLKAPADLNVDNDYDQAYPFAAGAYSFVLEPGVDAQEHAAPMPVGEGNAELASVTVSAGAGEVDSSGKVKAGTGMATFPAITFKKPGFYTYTVTEVIPDDATALINGTSWTYADARTSAADVAGAVWSKDGVVYTQATHNIYVEVTDNGKGELRAEVTYRNPETPGNRTPDPTVFTNRYHTADVAVIVGGTKTVNSLAPGEGYSFRMERQPDDDSHRADYAPVRYASSDASGAFVFPEVVFPQFRLDKTTVYHVSEVVPSDAVNASLVTYNNATEAQRAAGGFKKGAVTYDASVYEVRVSVKDNGNGTASTQTSYRKLRGFDGTSVTGTDALVDAIAITFDNRICTKPLRGSFPIARLT